ncbi:MAG TPA: DUF2142 domain-containing protein [Solirubrobacteraceae bacterium]|nr:DUF2142 domain-containing protein [Solirubrobacteraceae bacterium]
MPGRSISGRVARAWRWPSIDLRSIFARIPAIAWTCVSIAILNGVAWSIITPPFQGRDEPDHFAYVQLLAETGKLPRPGSEPESPAESLVLSELNQAAIRLKPQVPAISSAAQQEGLTRAVDANASSVGSGAAGVAASQPPLFYAIQTIPYALGSGNVLWQLQLMRLLAALTAGLTVLLIFFFLRELLPGVPWAATAGAMCVALQPLFGFMSGTLNPDTMLYAVSAGLFLCLARAFRRGLSRPLAVVTGLLIVVGFLTKLNFAGLAPGVFIGLIFVCVRDVRLKRTAAWSSFGIAAGIGILPAALDVLLHLSSSQPVLGIASESAAGTVEGSVFNKFSYIWQLYLPYLPGMTHYFQGMSTFWDVWFTRSVGLYGWIDTQFPGWVVRVALVPTVLILLLALREMFGRRSALRDRLPELLTYIIMTVGVFAMVGVASYDSDVISHVEAYGDPRYLLPMLPLLGAILTLAVRGAGRRWAPATAAAIVILFLSHDVFSQLQVIARYYA